LIAASGAILAIAVIPHAFGDAFLAVMLLGCATVGALLSSRRRENAVGWVLLAIALLAIIGALIDGYANSGLLSQRGLDSAAAVASGNLDFAWIALAGIVLPLIFPTGRLPSRRWRPVLWTGIGAVA